MDTLTFDLPPVHALISAPADKQHPTADLNTEDDKKARRRDECLLNQVNYRRRKRLPVGELARLPWLLPRMSKAQVALAKALGGYTPCQQCNDKLKATISSTVSEEMQLLCIAEWKKAHRKEQCRRAQARFQKRKREALQALIDSMAALNREIKQLKTRKAEVMKQPNQLGHLVTGFYSSFKIHVKEQQLPDVPNYEQSYGCTPALLVLADLQREEFDSMESLKLHWRWYRSQFRQFELSMTSYGCLEAGEHVIVKATGNLLLEVASEDKTQGRKRQIIVCPVLQQFEFENGSQVVQRITSEVDLVGGVSSTQGPVGTERVSSILRDLSVDFCSSNCDVGIQVEKSS